MNIIDAHYTLLYPAALDEQAKQDIYSRIETAARTCYKSEQLKTPNSAEKMVKALVRRGHEAMFEHAGMTVRFVVDRGVSHELVRHRLASYAQESTRYCNYSKDQFSGNITVIRPYFFHPNSPSYKTWEDACQAAEKAYFALLDLGETPERARSVLPNSLKTEVVATMNMRQWRHFFQLRAIGTTGTPHPQIRQVALPLLMEAAECMPELFGDIAEAAERQFCTGK